MVRVGLSRMSWSILSSSSKNFRFRMDLSPSSNGRTSPVVVLGCACGGDHSSQLGRSALQIENFVTAPAKLIELELHFAGKVLRRYLTCPSMIDQFGLDHWSARRRKPPGASAAWLETFATPAFEIESDGGVLITDQVGEPIGEELHGDGEGAGPDRGGGQGSVRRAEFLP